MEEKAIPHRCPVCDGRAWVDAAWYRGLPLTGRIACPSCEGTGVLWGPPGVFGKRPVREHVPLTTDPDDYPLA